MEKNGFFKHFLTIGIGTFVNMILGVLTTPLITRMVDPIDYGQLSIFNMYANIALMVFCLGLDQAVVRYYYEEKSKEYKQALLFKCIVLPVAVTILVSVVIVIASVYQIIAFEFDTAIVIWLCVYSFLQIVYRFSILLVRLEYNSRLFTIINIAQKLIYLLIAVPLLMIFSSKQLLIFVIATVFSLFLCMIVSILSQSDLWNFRTFNAKSCHVPQSELIKYALPFVISMGITTLFQAIDKISLNTYCTYAEVGIYSSAMSLVHIFAIIQTTFNTLWTPMAVEHYSKNKEDREFYKKGNKIITVIMYGAGILLILFKDLFAILLGEKYREAAFILPFLIFNPIMYTVSETTVSGLFFKKKSNMQVIVGVGSCIVNIIGNIILVPLLGGRGAAISTGLSYIVFFTLRTVLSNLYFYVDFKLSKFYLLTIFVAFYALYNTFVPFNIWSIFGGISCLGILVFLYQETCIWMFHYSKNFIQSTFKEVFIKKRK